MAFGPEPLGLIYFAGVKFVGYSAAALYLNKQYAPPNRRSPWFVGGARTAIGLLAGVGAIALLSRFSGAQNTVLFYLALAPVRMVEWLLLLALFFKPESLIAPRALGHAALGSLWSYCLDIPAAMALFALPGGAWIC